MAPITIKWSQRFDTVKLVLTEDIHAADLAVADDNPDDGHTILRLMRRNGTTSQLRLHGACTPPPGTDGALQLTGTSQGRANLLLTKATPSLLPWPKLLASLVPEVHVSTDWESYSDGDSEQRPPPYNLDFDEEEDEDDEVDTVDEDEADEEEANSVELNKDDWAQGEGEF